ncbi:MAG: tyrosine-type recombinase/integrase [Lachnospiraceae bacterium]|nr:tyrosine-type recombinase/integrase [Lachnospiraceae bacterium]
MTLSVLAACVQGKTKISITPEWQEELSLYIAVIAEPDKRKSSVFSALTSPIYSYAENYNLTQMQALKADDIQHMLTEISKTHSYSTMKKAYNNLNACLTLGTAKNEIIRNPMLTVTLPAKTKQETKEIRAYNRNEINAIVQECTRKYQNGKYVYRYGYAFLLMLNTGIRLGEALYLKWEDVDFETNTIYIHGNVSEHKSRENGETKYIIEEQHTPKSKISVRYVSLNKNAAEALRKPKEIVNDDTHVIATEEHTIVSPHNMHRIFSSILRKCNIAGVNDIVHSLRHTFATTLILKGEDIKVVSELLGHSDVGTKMRTYYHTIEKQKKKAVQRLDDLY